MELLAWLEAKRGFLRPRRTRIKKKGLTYTLKAGGRPVPGAISRSLFPLIIPLVVFRFKKYMLDNHHSEQAVEFAMQFSYLGIPIRQLKIRDDTSNFAGIVDVVLSWSSSFPN